MKGKKLTVLGTLKQNKPQVPKEFRPNRKHPVESRHNQEKTVCTCPEKIKLFCYFWQYTKADRG